MSKLRLSNIQISPLVVSGAGIGTYYNITLLCSYWRPGPDLGRGHAGDLHQHQRPSSGQVQYSTVQYSTVQRPSSGSARAANDPSVFTIMKKAPSNRAFPWLRAPSSPFTFEDMIKIKHLKTVSRRKNKCPYCVLNEKALERAFSVIMKTDGSFAALPQTEYKWQNSVLTWRNIQTSAQRRQHWGSLHTSDTIYESRDIKRIFLPMIKQRITNVSLPVNIIREPLSYWIVAASSSS